MASFEMVPYPRNNILDVYADRDSIQRNPVYQRISGVWDKRKRRLLIDSIINGVDLPKLYLHELTPPRKENGKLIRYAIIDGKQRLESIWEFMSDQFPLADTFRLFEKPELGGAGAYYSELAKERTYRLLRARFDSTDLPIVTVRTDDLELVEDLFSRLNEAVPLTAPEYRNTLGGPLPRVFRELATHDFFQDCLPFDTGRHRYLDLAAKFVYIVHEDDFVSTKRETLNQFVVRFRQGREEGQPAADPSAVKKLEAGVTDLLDGLSDFFLDNDPLLQGIGWVTLYFHVARLTRGKFPRNLSRRMFVDFDEQLMTTRSSIRAFESGSQDRRGTYDRSLAEFDAHRQSPNDGNALKTRYSILSNYLRKAHRVVLPPPEDD